MTEKTVRQALAQWGMETAHVTLAAARENTVYKLVLGTEIYALRLHRPGYRSAIELASELDWMAQLAKGGFELPRPIPARDGRLWVVLDGIAVDVLTWVDGVPMGTNGQLTSPENAAESYQALGRSMAKLHRLSDDWKLPEDFSRPSWDMEGLVGQEPLWGRFWENPALTPAQAALFCHVRDQAGSVLHDQKDALDFGLIHADLVPENVLLDHGKAHLIDFDDSGFGFRLFDLATTLNRARRSDHYDEYRARFLSAYQSERPIDLGFLPLFQVLRSLTYVGWIVPRMNEDGAASRNERFIREAEFWIGELSGAT